jgi:formylglycine-generating enzyme required for sulfatase activity
MAGLVLLAVLLPQVVSIVQQELARREAVQQEEARQEAACLEEARQEAAREEAVREAVRQEKARQKVARHLEAEQRKMVSVPAGEFFMGCNKKVDKACFENEKPGRTVVLDAFAIDTYEVTVASYRRCVGAGKCTVPNTGGSCNWSDPDHVQHPINCVNWTQADEYCRWVGKRLPTEAEWEKATRGTDGRVYPWGNGWEASKANVDSSNGTVPVGSYPAGISPYGAHDMTGNVWEWTADWYTDDYHKNGPTQNPKGPEQGAFRSVRGGSWGYHPRDVRASSRGRYTPGVRLGSLGFRCAR